MGYRRPLQRHASHLALPVLDRFFNSRRHFIGLTIAPADSPLAIAYDDQGIKTESPSTLDHRGTTANLHHRLGETIAATALTWFILFLRFLSRLSHSDPSSNRLTYRTLRADSMMQPLELQARLACRIRQRLDPTMILIMTPVEGNLVDSLLLRPLPKRGADQFRSLLVAAR